MGFTTIVYFNYSITTNFHFVTVFRGACVILYQIAFKGIFDIVRTSTIAFIINLLFLLLLLIVLR